MRKLGILLGAVGLAATSIAAHAFCGFYVSGGDKKLFNDATQVVLMRDGTRTILSMQNDYRGPLEDFAMVVPVPVVLKPTDVKVLEKGVFERTDALGSPRLVEYWEEDPCPPPIDRRRYRALEKRQQSIKVYDMAPSMDGGGGGGGAVYLDEEKPRPEPKHIAPVLGSFTANPTSITADVATPVTFAYTFSNRPYPMPSCSIDHNVGAVSSGSRPNVTLAATTKLELTCANDAGTSKKQIEMRVVKIEAKFDVAEYQILILSATEAAGLEEWLKNNGYKIPADAEKLLRPYIEAGSKFFVAKVDPKKVKFEDNHAALSPLRFQYDSEDFSLPIRLGLANSGGKQDLVVNILSDKRYEVANYKNVFIPTNFDVKPSVKGRFGEFYAALFDKTVEANPGAVITEYAWTAIPNYHCDPCTEADITSPDLVTLGADVTGGKLAQGYFVLTRLHARYGKGDMKDDLRFREAKAVVGGREQWAKDGLEYGAKDGPQNFFQARFAIRHWWTGPIKCKSPRRGVWGGPPDGNWRPTQGAVKTAFAKRGKFDLAVAINRDIWEIGFKKRTPPKVVPPAQQPPGPKTMGFLAVLALAFIVLIARRRLR